MHQYNSLRSLFILYTKGIVMGGADIIPGVSGGTIALISGIYEHLIQAISSVGLHEIVHALKLPFVIGNREKRAESLAVLGNIPWIFLFTLLAGIVTGIISMAFVIPAAMEQYPFYTYAFFFGLILFSLTIPFRKMNHAPVEYGVAILFGVATYFVVGFSSVSGARIHMSKEVDGVLAPAPELTLSTDNNGKWSLRLPTNELIDPLVAEVVSAGGESLGNFRLEKKEGQEEIPEFLVSQNLNGATVFVRKVHASNESIILTGALALEGSATPLHLFISGFLAISAMILPGISGAYILVLLGEYKTVLTALHDRNLLVLGVFISGIVVGIFSFIRILKYLLEHYHSITMAALTGIMAGSLKKIWPGDYMEPGDDPVILVGGIAIALFGALLVFALERASIRLEDPDSPI